MDAIKIHPNSEQILQNMFDGKTDVDLSNKGLDAGDAFIIAAALEKNDQVTGLHALRTTDKLSSQTMPSVRTGNSLTYIHY